MKQFLRVEILPFLALLTGSLVFNAGATTYYVSINSANPVSPYSSWATAATNIQNALDAATNGDLVLVTNGVYQPVGRPAPAPDNILTCVICTNAVTLQSVNGSAVTVINGSGTNRCVYLGNGAVFSGFTVTGGNVSSTYSTCGGVDCASNALVENCLINNNSAYTAGGLYFGTASNCVISGNYATGQAGGAQQSILIDCTVSGNSSGVISGENPSGRCGGVFNCTLTNCVLTGNSSAEAGGASYGTLNNCTVYNNSGFVGAGAEFCTLNDCLVFSNSATSQSYRYSILTAGGGMYFGTANNCIILGNQVQLDERSSASGAYGGGVYNATLNNCALLDNYILGGSGGGAYGSTLNNCTVAGNSAAGGFGGGAYGSSANNCIIYYNTAIYYVSDFSTANATNCALNYCCTFPLPSSGVGFFNFTNAPLIVSLSGTGGNLHLQTNSPCINSGNNAYVTGSTDLDGNPRVVGGTVDIGAYEFQTPKSAISYAWLQQYGLPADGSVDYADLDGTAFNVYQDWNAGLNPTNPASVLAMRPPTSTNNAAGITVSWQSVRGIPYLLQRSTNLAAQPAFSTILSVTGQSNTTSYTDTSATNSVPYFYRVGAQ